MAVLINNNGCLSDELTLALGLAVRQTKSKMAAVGEPLSLAKGNLIFSSKLILDLLTTLYCRTKM